MSCFVDVATMLGLLDAGDMLSDRPVSNNHALNAGLEHSLEETQAQGRRVMLGTFFRQADPGLHLYVSQFTQAT